MTKTQSTLSPALPSFIIASLIFLALTVGITWESWISLWQWWHSHGSSYSHGTVIVALMIWLIYDHWGQLQNNQPKPKAQFILAISVGIAASAVWTLGKLMSIDFFYWISLPAIAGSLFIAASDKKVRFHSIAPFIAFIFAVPVWEITVPFLQHLAVHVVRLGIGLTGIPAFIEDINVNIPGGRFVVEGGCSGVRYLLVSVAITSLWSYLYIPERKRAALLIICGALISILTNWIRIYAIIIIGYETKMQSSLVHDHEFFGWILFAVALIPMMLLGLKFEKQAIAHKAQNNISSDTEIKPEWNLKSFVLGLILVGTLPLSAQIIDTLIQDQPAPMVQRLQIKNFSNENLVSSSVFGGWKPEFQGVKDWYSMQAKSSKLEIMIGHIPHQSQEHELFSSENVLTDTQSKIWKEDQVNDLLHITSIYGQSWVIKDYYRVGGEMTRGGFQGKILQVSSILKMRNDAQLILLGLRCTNDCSAQQSQLRTITDQDINDLLSQ